jgi:hypothetical protein
MYGRCVEYFDSACDPVRWYFIEKISSTLAESKTRIKKIIFIFFIENR